MHLTGCAPVVLFVYNRLRHTQQTIEALRRSRLSQQTALYIYSDGAESEKDQKSVSDVRSYIKSVDGFGSIEIVEKDRNLGLAESIVAGITEIVTRHDKVIILEDDLRTSPYFLQFMNDGLALYNDNDRVVSIHGYIYPVKTELPETFFLRGADCWGWATWKRGWDIFERDGVRLLNELKMKNLNHEFDLNGSYPYTQMLQDQIDGKNDSWAIRWHASAFLKEKLTLYPGRSLVQNIGMDRSGKHSGRSRSFDVDLAASPIAVSKIPIEENCPVREQVEHFMRSLKPGGLRRLYHRIKMIPDR